MSPNSSEPPIILVVDDDPAVLTGISALLAAAGYDCHGALDQASAVAAARSLALDLVICDVSLAGSSGLDLCRHIRSQPGRDDVPIMFLSSAQIPDIVHRSHEAGGAYYLRKPFQPDVLLELVGKALWMPHVVSTRLNFAQAAGQFVPVARKLSSIYDAIGGITMPSA